MEKITVFFLALALCAGASAEQLVSTVADDGSLRVIADPDVPLQTLIEIDDPGVTSPVYAIKGMLRYEGVNGTGFLQMDNYFGEKDVYFTKSLADRGPMQKITGASDWREFVLPFTVTGSDTADDDLLTLQRITLGVYLPQSGSVELRDVALYQFGPGENPLQTGTPWVSASTMGLVGGIGGALIGLWGALAGVLAGRGKARSFVVGSASLLVAVGVGSVGVGAGALITGQPYDVYFPFLLFGVLLVFVVGGLRMILPRRYEAIELKKIQSMDV